MIILFGKAKRLVVVLSTLVVVLWLFGSISFASSTPEATSEKPSPKKLNSGDVMPYNPGKILAFPSPIEGIDVGTKEPSNYSTKDGRATMVIFIASWCEPCQVLAPKIRVIADKYSKLHTDVVFVFTHDTLEDAAQFAKDHSLKGKLLLSNEKLLNDFKVPPIPSVYVSDRHKYMIKRHLNLKLSDLEDLSDLLDKLNLL